MEELLLKAIKGDKDSFMKIINSMEKKLYFVAKSKIDNEEDVKDVIQETIFKCYKHIKKIKDPSKFSTWIITILINNCNQFYREKKNLNYCLLDENYTNDLYHTNEYSKIDDKVDFFELLKILDENERLIFTLYYSNNYTTKQISEILKINENTIKSKIKRSKDKIQKYVERCD